MREVGDFVEGLSQDHRQLLLTFLKWRLGPWSDGCSDTELRPHLPDRFSASLASDFLALQKLGAIEPCTGRWRLTRLGYDAAQATARLPPGPVPPEIEGPVNSVSDAVYQAQALYRDSLEFLPSALSSVGGDPDKAGSVQAALRELGELARDYFRREPPGHGIGPWEPRFARIGVKYAVKESQTTMGKFGSERKFIWKGKKETFVSHLTITGRYGGIQVFFRFDHDSRRIVVAYVGPHLSYARQRT